MATYQRVNASRTYLLLLYLSIFLTTVICQANPGGHTDVNQQPQAGENKLNVQEMSKDGVTHAKVQPKLANSPECQEDATKLCGAITDKDDFPILSCLLEHAQEDSATVSAVCQHKLWVYRSDLTKDRRISDRASDVCKSVIHKHCSEDLRKGELLLSCLIENVDEAEEETPCKRFIQRILTIVFGDFKFMEPYFTHCTDDVKRLGCGRAGQTNKEEFWSHSEGETIECLMNPKHHDTLNAQCKKELLKVAELQSDDYHMDRPLYYACKSSRQVFCAEVASGAGAVYNCLMQKINDPKMPEKCHNMLLRRQKMLDEDIKIDKAFYDACKGDIEKYECAKHGDIQSHSRADLMTCLEDHHNNGMQLSGECAAQLNIEREEVMENPETNSDFAKACKAPLEYCAKSVPQNDGTKIMHCIMELVESQNSGKTVGVKVTDECRKQVKLLLEEVDVGEDYTMDTSLRKACAKDAARFCSEEKESDAKVLGCLMRHVDDGTMYSLCVQYLHDTNYFIARDYKLDHELRASCHKDAVALCNAPDDFQHANTKDAETPVSHVYVLPCLYRLRQKINADCREAVKRLMHERAASVDMMPELEEPCMSDLAKICSKNTAKGEELECLEKHIDDLTAKCKAAIEQFIKEEEEDVQMDHAMITACKPIIHKYCKDEEKEDAEENDLLDCLIEHKHSEDTPPKCTAQITHHELLMMKDYTFSHALMEHCKDSLLLYCKDKHDKYGKVVCLSEIVRDDVMNDAKPRIKKPCRKQLHAELQERTLDIDLDPILHEKCEQDIEKFCENITPGPGAILECLKKHQKSLSSQCSAALFSREMVDAAMNVVDVAVLSACKRMVAVYCKDAQASGDQLACLKMHKNEPNFDQKCHDSLVQHQITENRDYRLNPDLIEACHKDIKKFCSHITDTQKDDTMLEGKVITCLKHEFTKQKLSQDCEGHVGEIVRDAALDFREDASLVDHCHDDISTLCAEELENPDNVDEMGQPRREGNVEDCLKLNFQRIKNKECQKEVARLFNEGHADIHSDPHLFEVCQKIVKTHCSDVMPGDGRVMSCLVDLLDQRRLPAGKCYKRLAMRKQMWEYAAKVLPPESLGELLEAIHSSQSRFYLIGVILAILGIILIAGVMCGRVTKRVRQEVKNR